MRETCKQIGSAGAARMFSLAATTVGVLLSARWLGPEGRGIFATVTTWAVVLATLGHFSLGQVALQRRISGARNPLGTDVGTLLALDVVVTFLAWLTLALVVFPSDSVSSTVPASAVALAAIAIPFVIWEHYGSYLLMAVDRLAVYNRALVIGRSAELASIVLLVGVLKLDVAGALIAFLLGQATVSMVGVRVLYERASGRIRVDLAALGRLLVSGGQLHLSAVGALLASYVSILVVQHYSGPRETGWYQLAVQLTGVMLVLAQAAAQVLYSKMAVVGPDAVWPQQRRAIAVILGVIGILCVLAWVLSPAAIRWTVGEAFLPTVPVFRLLLFSVLGRAVGFLMGPQWIGRGLFWQVSVVTFLLGVVDVGLACMLVPRFGMRGAAYASLTVYGVGAVVNLALALRIERSVRERVERTAPSMSGR